jgi:hypothetical protein
MAQNSMEITSERENTVNDIRGVDGYKRDGVALGRFGKQCQHKLLRCACGSPCPPDRRFQ